MTTINSTFKLGDQTIEMETTKKAKYCLTMDGETYYLCTARQIHAAINSSAEGRFISLNGVFMELTNKKRGSCKAKKLEGVTISRITPQAPSEVSEAQA